MSSMSRFAFRGMFIAAAGLLLHSGAGVAQEARAAATPREEIVVVAPRFLHKKARVGTSYRLPVYSVTVEHSVSYAGLDLSTPSDAAELRKRIDETAKQICIELDQKYPKTIYVPLGDTKHCVETASAEGQARAQEVIAAFTQ